MIYGSVCSGIEAASVAWEPLGWQPAWFSEIEPFPCAVLKHHFPTVPNLGDMTKFKEWPNGTIDLLVGGTPCQSFSVAGLRKGLADPRGNLMLTYLAILDRFRPRWMVWENVPGVLSSGQGRDFGTFIGGLAELGYGFAWRVLDAKHFCTNQHRERVFVVGHSFGSWRSPTAVLLKRNSLFGCASKGQDAIHSHDKSPSSRSCGAIAFGWQNSASQGLSESDISFPSLDKSKIVAVMTADGVRRLTPIEYERIQGFPDNWTRIPWRKKPAEKCPDDPRYKAIGNSMAVPCMRWIGERIQMVEEIMKGKD